MRRPLVPLLAMLARALATVALVLLAPSARAQRSLAGLTPAERSAVRAYLAPRPTLRVLVEADFDAEALWQARTKWSYGAAFTPFLQRGGFSGDRRAGLAALMANASSAQHRVVVFNRLRTGRYQMAYDAPIGPLADPMYLRVESRRLSAGTMQTDPCVRLVYDASSYREVICGL